jgi:DNA-binding transcriptional regulator YdaS (Cro superfamily)
VTAPRLSDEQVRELRERYAAGSVQVELAARFAVSQTLVSLLVTGQRRGAAGGPIQPRRRNNSRGRS